MVSESQIDFVAAKKFMERLCLRPIVESFRKNLVMGNLVAWFRDDEEIPGGIKHQAESHFCISPEYLTTKRVPFDLTDENYMAGQTLAKAMESDLLGLSENLSQTVATWDIIPSDILEAVNYLDLAKAPKNRRSLFLHPGVKAELPFLPHAFQTFRHEAVPQKQKGNRAVFHNLFFQRGAFGLKIRKGPTIEICPDPERDDILVMVYLFYDYALLNEKLAVNIVSS